MKFQFQIFLLTRREFPQEILDLYDIYYSKFFKSFVTFNPAVRELRRTISRVVGFGDLTLDPQLKFPGLRKK